MLTVARRRSAASSVRRLGAGRCVPYWGAIHANAPANRSNARCGTAVPARGIGAWRPSRRRCAALASADCVHFGVGPPLAAPGDRGSPTACARSRWWRCAPTGRAREAPPARRRSTESHTAVVVPSRIAHETAHASRRSSAERSGGNEPEKSGEVSAHSLRTSTCANARAVPGRFTGGVGRAFSRLVSNGNGANVVNRAIDCSVSIARTPRSMSSHGTEKRPLVAPAAAYPTMSSSDPRS